MKLFDFNDISFSSHYLPFRTVVLAMVFTVYATLKLSMMMTMWREFHTT